MKYILNYGKEKIMNEELIAKAKEAKSVEELLTLAKENDYPLTEERAKELFEQFHESGELSDEELDMVGGGCGAQYTEGGYFILPKSYNAYSCFDFLPKEISLMAHNYEHICYNCKYLSSVCTEERIIWVCLNRRKES